MRTMKQLDKVRHAILGLEYDDKPYDIKRIELITLKQLLKLKEKEFIDLEEAQNSSPTIGEFIDFMTLYPKFKAHGYIVTPDRSDYRISLEGLQTEEKLTKIEMVAFSNKFHNADDFWIEEHSAYCWWD